MKKERGLTSFSIVSLLIILSSFQNISFANEVDESIDVRNLQTCLKEKDASLDVLVLMDSSRSLRDGKPGEKRDNPDGSDPKKIRGPILKSSLTLLQKLADESGKPLRVNLKNFGNNSSEDGLKALKEKWLDWTPVTNNNSNVVLSDLVERALFDDSRGTQWGQGLATAREAFSARLSEASTKNQMSCPIMFWITDGAPTDKQLQAGSNQCSSNYQYSLDWFRQRNILVLGGLLKPPNEDVSIFAPIVTGSECPEVSKSWTRGSVIEADNPNSLAWQFVSLIAGIKNLVNLDIQNGTFDADPGTSHIETFIKGLPAEWEIKTPDGKVFCSSIQPSNLRCKAVKDPQIGITTITIFPDSPIKTGGKWSITPGLKDGDVKVYGGMSSGTYPAQLVISPENSSVDEGKEKKFQASLKNADGSPLKISDYQSVEICAEVKSSGANICKSGGPNLEIGVFPNSSDKSIPFQALLTSTKDDSRKYRISAVATISVLPSGKFSSLICGEKSSGETCQFAALSNKNDKGSNILKIVGPADGGSGGQIYLVDYPILQDVVSDRGDGNFTFTLTQEDGKQVNWNSSQDLFSAGDVLNLGVSTEKGGSSNIAGVINYVVVGENNEKIFRQLNFTFDVSDSKNRFAQVALLLLAYLLTIGLPYLYLLISARRSAFLCPPYDEFSYVIAPFEITKEGKLVSPSGPENNGENFIPPSHKDLNKIELPSGSRVVNIGSVLIEVIPPKWNPFVDPVTRVSIPQQHLLTTFSAASLSAGSGNFGSSLVNDAILFFATEENLAPITRSTIDTGSSENKNDIFNSTYEAKIREDLTKADKPVSGSVIFVLPSFGNKKMLLDQVTTKLVGAIETAEISKQIVKLREESLKKVQEKIEADRAALVAKNEGNTKGKAIRRLGKNKQGRDGNEKNDSRGSESVFGETDIKPNLWGADDVAQTDIWGTKEEKPDIWGIDGSDSGKGPKSWS